MVRLELQYIKEIKHINQTLVSILDELLLTIGLKLCDNAFPNIIKEAENYSWTGDPVDRLIVAQVSLNEAPLITKDEVILANYSSAI